MKTNVILSITFLVLALSLGMSLRAQDLQDKAILIADESYGKEIILLPVEWAPNMTIEGFEELRFSPGWNDTESPEFWSYVLSWDVKASDPLTSNELEINLEQYFDGLMKPNHWAKEFAEPAVKLMHAGTTPDSYNYTGKMRYFDGFHTGKVITTNIMAVQFFCMKTQRTIVVFRISPQSYDHPVWDRLKAIKKRADFCAEDIIESKD